MYHTKLLSSLKFNIHFVTQIIHYYTIQIIHYFIIQIIHSLFTQTRSFYCPFVSHRDWVEPFVIHIPLFFSVHSFVINMYFWIYRFHALFGHNIYNPLSGFYVTQAYYHHTNPTFISSFKSYFHFVVQIQHSLIAQTRPFFCSFVSYSDWLGQLVTLLCFPVNSFVNMYFFIYQFHKLFGHSLCNPIHGFYITQAYPHHSNPTFI